MMSTWRSSFFTSKRPRLFEDPPSNQTLTGTPECRSVMWGQCRVGSTRTPAGLTGEDSIDQRKGKQHASTVMRAASASVEAILENNSGVYYRSGMSSLFPQLSGSM